MFTYTVHNCDKNIIFHLFFSDLSMSEKYHIRDQARFTYDRLSPLSYITLDKFI